MTPEQTKFLTFLFSLIGSIALIQLSEKELTDFVNRVFKKYSIKENNTPQTRENPMSDLN